MRTLAALSAVVAAAAALAAAALASVPPPKPLLINVARARIGAATTSGPAIVLTSTFGPADLIATAPNGTGTVMLWLDGRRPWATATLDGASPHATSLLYRGPLRTTRKDRTGTTLRVFLRHWPKHDPAKPVAAMPGYVSVGVGRVRFLFNQRRRLAAVALGTDAALALAHP